MKRLSIPVIFLILGVSCGHYLEGGVESPVIEGERVTLRLKSPYARTVQVAGDWNNWAQGDAESGEVMVGLMEKRERDGIWEITLVLSPGRYRYKFLINEVQWILDPCNPRDVDDGRGGKANLLIMP